MSNKKGCLISIEGIDASGKSSNISFLKERLEHRGYTVITTREPGGTPLSEKIREMLLKQSMSYKTELLLFAASRAEHMAQKILPAIEQGFVVVTDRFADSSYAYQGIARGLKKDVLLLEEFVLEGFEPDYTLFFNITLEESLKRLNLRTEEQNRLDLEIEEFRRNVHRGYIERFKANPHRMHEINSMGTPDEVTTQVIRWVDEVFVPNNPL